MKDGAKGVRPIGHFPFLSSFFLNEVKVMGPAKEVGWGMEHIMPSDAGEVDKSSGPTGSITYIISRSTGLAEAKASRG